MKTGRIFIVIILLLLLNKIQNETIRVTNYSYASNKVQDKIRILHITDLHSREFGESNKRLIQKIKEQEPDIIFMTGDMLNDTDTNHDVILNLVKEAVKIAPVYYAMGNHESKYADYYDLISDLEDVGVKVMDDFYKYVDIKGNTVGVFGAYSFVGVNYSEVVVRKLIEFSKTDELKIILTHDPTVFLKRDKDRWKYDLVFAGHYHGGQMRLPFVGGVRAPNGWFPEYDMGEYNKSEYTVYISSGLGSEPHLPRINNFPELLVVDVLPMH